MGRGGGKLIARLRWSADWLSRELCGKLDRCRGIERRTVDPRCGGCWLLPPALEGVAEDIWSLWVGVQTQWRQGPHGRTGLDYAAVVLVGEVLGVEARNPVWWRMVTALEVETLNLDAARMQERLDRAEWSGRARK